MFNPIRNDFLVPVEPFDFPRPAPQTQSEPCDFFGDAREHMWCIRGPGNIVVGCFHRTWWYGANRGICQKQSGVMEERDRAGAGGGERNSLGRDKISSEHQLCVETKTRTWAYSNVNTAEERPHSKTPQYHIQNALDFHWPSFRCFARKITEPQTRKFSQNATRSDFNQR